MSEMTMSTEAAPRAGSLRLVDALLRDRGVVCDRIAAEQELSALVRTMLLAVIAGGALFGAAVGSYRGGIQIAYGAVKFPLVLLLTAAVCAPTLTAVQSALGRPASIRRDLALVTSALALTSLVLAAAAPLMVLGARPAPSSTSTDRLIDYHGMALILFAAGAAAGAAGLAMFWRGLGARRGPGRLAVFLPVLVVFVLVGAQMAWTLRPYLVRPRSPDVVFVRSLEGSLIEAVGQTLRSARGDYFREAAPLPGEDE
ncbi:MAG TPA: hypothetical protein VFU21_18620 [Kofleriaceae bacterium]|nr:hypothetical protein [Kofleriaceae bacterium]